MDERFGPQPHHARQGREQMTMWLPRELVAKVREEARTGNETQGSVLARRLGRDYRSHPIRGAGPRKAKQAEGVGA